MVARVQTLQDAAAAFNGLADAEEPVIPTYARICRIIAADPTLYSLLLEAPTGQRLPVLVLAAIHDVVLRHPDSQLRPWYPSVYGRRPSTDDPSDALGSFVAEHRSEIETLVRSRSIQTNEVNRSAGWRLLLASITAVDRRPIHLVELGASAGLNLNLDLYACRVDPSSGDSFVSGPLDSPLIIHVEDHRPLASAPQDWEIKAPIVARTGLDQNPLDLSRPEDARWLRACTWPEQLERFDALDKAIALQAAHPVDLREGDMVEDLANVLDEVGDNSHAVVLSSWALAYLPRVERSRLVQILASSAVGLSTRGTRLTLLTLESPTILDWVSVPPPGEDVEAALANASILAQTDFLVGPDGGRDAEVRSQAVARCHAHVRWIEPI